MNEKFGFLSTFKGIRVKPKPKKPSTGELTDNPQLINYGPMLTDDESDGEEADIANIEDQRIPVPVNRIFGRGSSSLLPQNSNETFCSELEEIKKKVEKVCLSSELFNTDDLKTQPSTKASNKLSDTVIGSFSDDELCSRMSEVNVAEASKAIEANKPSKIAAGQADTLIGGFSDLSEDEEEFIEPQIQPKKILKKPPRPSLPDTIIGFSDSSSQFIQPLPVQKTRRPTLRETILGFSESIMESIQEQEPSRVSMTNQEDEEVISNSDNSVLSIESEYEDEVISILDSDEENSFPNEQNEPPLLASSDSFRNCSSINISSKPQSEKITSTESTTGNGTERESETTLNKFFNNPPSIKTPERFITHSMVKDQKQGEAQNPRQASSSKIEILDNSRIQANDSDLELNENDESALHESLEIPETEASADQESFDNEVTSEDENHETPSSEIVSSERTQIDVRRSTQSISQSLLSSQTNQTLISNINFSASININLKISMREPSSSSGSDSSSSSDSSPPTSQPASKKKECQQRKETPKSCQPQNKSYSARKENQKAPGSSSKKTPVALVRPSSRVTPWVSDFENTSPRTPVRSEQPEKIIDEDLQEILDSLYGDTWKTPQLLKSIKSKTVRTDLRKSLHANNFETFVKNLPNNLESTRIGNDFGKKIERIEEKSSAKKKADFTTPTLKKTSAKTLTKSKPATTNSFKKTPAHLISDSDSDSEMNYKKYVPKTPVDRCREICDNDTPSEFESSSDSEFIADETWNASSDGEYADEPERIKKKRLTKKSHKNEEIIFVPSTEVKQKKLDDLLDRREFKKPPGMPVTPRQISKKKLFTHDHFEDEAGEPPKEDEMKENVIPVPNLRDIFLKSPFHVPKIPEKKTVVLPSPAKKNQKVVKTPSLKINKQYSFLRSLDPDACSHLCNPDALFYRDNFKSKKEELAVILFKMFDEKVFNGALKDVPMTWNKNLTQTAGRCKNHRSKGIMKSEVELSIKVLTSADRLRCTLIHEMCHAATWILHGENGHGSTWKQFTRKANSIFPGLPKITVTHEYAIEYRYTYKCVSCNSKYQTHSKSKKVEAIRCSICKSSIELFLNKRNKQGEVEMVPVSKEIKGFPKFVQLNYKIVKKPEMTHKEVMQVLSAQFGTLTVEEKKNL